MTRLTKESTLVVMDNSASGMERYSHQHDQERALRKLTDDYEQELDFIKKEKVPA